MWCAPVLVYVYVFLYSKQVKCVLWLLDFFYFVNRIILGGKKTENVLTIWNCGFVIFFVDFMVSAFVGLL